MTCCFTSHDTLSGISRGSSAVLHSSPLLSHHQPCFVLYAHVMRLLSTATEPSVPRAPAVLRAGPYVGGTQRQPGTVARVLGARAPAPCTAALSPHTTPPSLTAPTTSLTSRRFCAQLHPHRRQSVIPAESPSRFPVASSAVANVRWASQRNRRRCSVPCRNG
jgi:hypothetical protein